MDSNSLLSRARAKALEKRKSRGNEVVHHINREEEEKTSHEIKVVSTKSNDEIVKDDVLESRRIARDKASTLLQKARSRVTNVTSSLSSSVDDRDERGSDVNIQENDDIKQSYAIRTQLIVDKSKSEVDQLQMDKTFDVSETDQIYATKTSSHGLKIPAKENRSIKEQPILNQLLNVNGDASSSSAQDIQPKLPKKKTASSHSTGTQGGTFDDNGTADPSHLATLIWKIYKPLISLSPPKFQHCDERSKPTEAYGLSSDDTLKIAMIVKDLESCVKEGSNTAPSGIVLVLGQFLSLFSEQKGDYCMSDKLPLAIGASGGCRLISEILVVLCQQEKMNTCDQEALHLCLNCVLHLISVNRKCIVENLLIFQEEFFMRHFNMIYSKYATLNSSICETILNILSIVATERPSLIMQNKGLIEVIMRISNHDGHVVTAAFSTLTALTSTGESDAQTLVDCGLLEAVNNSLEKSFKNSDVYAGVGVVASACETLCCLLLQDKFLEKVLSSTSLCENVVLSYVTFNSKSNSTCRNLVKCSLLCIARLAGHSPKFGINLLRHSTCDVLNELWKNNFQYKSEPDVEIVVLFAAVILTDIYCNNFQSILGKTIPESVYSNVVALVPHFEGKVIHQLITCMLMFNLLKIGQMSKCSYMENYDICEILSAMFQIILTENDKGLGQWKNVRRELQYYMVCAISYLCSNGCFFRESLRKGSFGKILEVSLTTLWEDDKELHFMTLRALSHLYIVCINDDEIRQQSQILNSINASALTHILNLATRKKTSDATATYDTFMSCAVAECDIGVVACNLLLNFSLYENCHEILDESSCIVLCDALKRRQNITVDMCCKLMIVFRNMLERNGPSTHFLEGSFVTIIYDMLSSRTLHSQLCDPACQLLYAVIMSCKENNRNFSLDCNGFFLKNVMQHHSEMSVAPPSFCRSVVGILNVLNYSSTTNLETHLADVQFFLISTLRSCQSDTLMLKDILQATSAWEVVFSTLMQESANDIIHAVTSIMHRHMGNFDVCAEVLIFLDNLSNFGGEKMLTQSFGRSKGLTVLVHCLSVFSNKPQNEIAFFRSAIIWLNRLCSASDDAVIRLVRQLNGCMLTLSLLDLAVAFQDSLVAFEVSTTINMMLKTSRNRKIFRDLNAMDFIFQALQFEWPDCQNDIIENLFWAIYMICDSGTSNNQQGNGEMHLNWMFSDNVNTDVAVVEIISKRLKQGMMNCTLATAACAVVSCLCFDVALKNKLGEDGICNDCVAFLELFKTDLELVKHATLALYRLTSNSSLNVDLVRGETFFALVFELLQNAHMSSEEICINLVSVVNNCTEDVISTILKEEVVPKICSGFAIFEDSTRHFSGACETLLSLASKKSSLLSNVPMTDVVPLIKHGMLKLKDDVSVCCHGCLLLGSLVENNYIGVSQKEILEGLESIIMSIVDAHQASIAVGESACSALLSLAKLGNVQFSDLRFYETITKLLNESEFDSHEFTMFIKALNLATLQQYSEQQNLTAIDKLAFLRQSFITKDNNAFLSGLLSLQSYAERGLSCCLSLQQNDGLEVLIEAVSVWRDQPLLVATTFKTINTLCSLKGTKSYNMSTLELLKLNLPELVLSVVMELWETLEIVSQGTLILRNCLSMNRNAFASFKIQDMHTVLLTILGRHVQIPDVVFNVCSIMKIIAPLCIEFFTQAETFVPVVDALRIHLSKEVENGGRGVCVRICEMIGHLLQLGENRISIALGRSEYPTLVVCALSHQHVYRNQLLSLQVLSSVLYLLDSTDEDTSLQISKNIEQVGGCRIFVDMLNKQRSSEDNVDVAALLCEIINRLFNNVANARQEIRDRDTLTIVVNTCRVFLHHKMFCEVACRCVQSIFLLDNKFEVENSFHKTFRIVADILKRHSDDDGLSITCMSTIAQWSHKFGDLQELFDEQLCSILSSMLVSGGEVGEVIVQSCLIFCSQWPKLLKNSVFANQSFFMLDMAISAMRLHQDKHNVIVHVIALITVILENVEASSHPVDTLTYNVLFDIMAEMCKSKNVLLSSTPRLPFWVCSLLAEMCKSSECLLTVADSQIFEDLTVAVDHWNEDAMLKEKCILVWCRQIELQCEADPKIISRIVNLLGTLSDKEDIIVEILSALRVLCICQDNGKFVLDKEANTQLVSTILSRPLTIKSAGIEAEILCALLQAQGNKVLQVQSQANLLSHFTMSALELFTREDEKMPKSCSGICASVSLATMLTSSIAEPLPSFDHCRFCRSLEIILYSCLNREPLEIVSVHKCVSSFLTHNKLSCESFFENGNKNFIELICRCFTVHTLSIELVESTWCLTQALVAVSPKVGKAIAQNSGIIENVMATLDGSVHCTEGNEFSFQSSCSVKYCCETVQQLVIGSINLKKAENGSVSMSKSEKAIVEHLFSSRLFSGLISASLAFLTEADTLVSCMEAISAICLNFPSIAVSPLLNLGVCSVIVAGLEMHIKSRNVFISLLKAFNSLTLATCMDHIEPVFLSCRFKNIITELFQANLSESNTLVEICRCISTLSGAGIIFPIDTPLMVEYLCRSLSDNISDSFLTLELLIIIHGSVTIGSSTMRLPDIRHMWRSCLNGDVLTSLINVVGKYAQIETIVKNALGIIHSLSVYEPCPQGENRDDNIFTEDRIRSLLSLTTKIKEAKSSTVDLGAALISIARTINNACSADSTNVSKFIRNHGFNIFQEELRHNMGKRDVIYELLCTLVTCSDSELSFGLDANLIDKVIELFQTDGLILSLAIRLQSHSSASGVPPNTSLDPESDGKESRSQIHFHEASELLGLLKGNIKDGKIVTGLCLGLLEFVRKNSEVASLILESGGANLIAQAMQLYFKDEDIVKQLLNLTVELMTSTDGEDIATFERAGILDFIVKGALSTASSVGRGDNTADKYLQCVALFSSSRKSMDILRQEKIIEYSVHLLLSKHKIITAVQCSAASLIAFRILISQSDADYTEIVTHQLVSALLYLVDKHGCNHSPCAYSLFALLSILSESSTGLSILIDEKVSSHVMDPLDVNFKDDRVVSYGLRLLRKLANDQAINPFQSLKTKDGCNICLKILIHFHKELRTAHLSEDKVSILENLFFVSATIINNSPLLSRLFLPHVAVIESFLVKCVEINTTAVEHGVSILQDAYGAAALGSEIKSESSVHKFAHSAFQYCLNNISSDAGAMRISKDLCKLIIILVNKSEDYQSILGRTGLCDVLITFMAHDAISPEILLVACSAVCSICRNHDVNIEAIHAGGAVRIIAGLLRVHLNKDSELVGTALIGVIITLINDNAKRSLLYGTDEYCCMISDYFSRVLSSPESASVVAELICVLSRDQTDNANNIAVTSILKSLNQALISHADDKNLIRITLRALWYIYRKSDVSEHKFIRELAMSKTIQSLSARHGEDNTGPLREGVGALIFVSLLEYYNKPPQIFHSCFINAISSRGDLELTKSGLDAICRFCGDPDNCIAMLNLGVDEQLRKVFLEKQDSADIIEGCCNAMATLCEVEEGIVPMIKIGVIEMLTSALSIFANENSAVCIAALKCFSALLQQGYSDIARDLIDRQIYNVGLTLVEIPLSRVTDNAATAEEVAVIEHVLKLFGAIIGTVPTSAFKFGVVGVVEVVMCAVRSQLSTELVSFGIASEALSLLAKLCLEGQNITKVVLTGGFQSVIALTRKHHNENSNDSGRSRVAYCFADAIIVICTPSNTHCKQYQNSLGSCGAGELLADMTRQYVNQPRTLSKVLGALIAFCNGNEGNILSVFSRGVAATLSNIFSFLYDNMVENNSQVLICMESLCDLIHMLASSSPSNADSLGKVGLCDNIIELMQVSPNMHALVLLQCSTAMMKDNIGNQRTFGRNTNYYNQLKNVLGIVVSSNEDIENCLPLLSTVALSMTLLSQCNDKESSKCPENVKKLFKFELHHLLVTAAQMYNSYPSVAEAVCCALEYSLYGLNGEQLGDIGARGACDVVLNCFVNHNKNYQVIEPAMGALSHLSNSSENVENFKALGLDRIIAEMHVFSLSEEVSLKAPSALKRLCLDPDISSSFGSSGVCTEIESVLLQCEYVGDNKMMRTMLLDLILCISNLLQSCPHNSTHFLSVLPKLMEIMTSMKSIGTCDEDITGSICNVIYLLAQCEDLSVNAIVESQLCECLSDVFKVFKTVPSVILDVSKVITALSLKHELSEVFANLNVLSESKSLLQGLSEDDTALHASLNKLFHVLSCDTDMRADIGLRGDSSAISTLLRTHIDSESATLKNCRALKNLISKNSNHIDVLIEYGICETLMEIMRKFAKSIEILVECMATISFMLQKSEVISSNLEDVGGIEVIVGAFRRYVMALFDTPSTTKFHCLTLQAIYEFSTTVNYRQKFQAAGAPQIITEIYQSAINKWDEEVIMWCNCSIYRLCTDTSSNQDAFGVAGVCLCVSTVLNKFKDLNCDTIEAVLLALIFLSKSSSEDSAICENEQNAVAFYNLQCDRNVCRILSEMTSHVDVVRVACNAIFVLARDTDSVHRLASMGVAELLSDIIIMHSTQGTPEGIDVALVSICVMEPLLAYQDVIVCFADKTVLSYCLDILDQHPLRFSPRDLEKLCSVICQFAQWKEDLVTKMIKRGTCDMLVGVYKAQRVNDTRVAVAVSLAISALAISSDVSGIFLKLDTLSMILEMLKIFDSDKAVTAAACKALGALSTNTSFAEVMVQNRDEKNNYKIIVNVLRLSIDTKSVVVPCLDAFINIYKYTVEMTEIHNALLVKAGLCELLPAIMRKHSESTTVVHKGCLVMSKLCQHNQAANTLVSCGACEAVTKGLDLFVSDCDVALYGCCFIHNISNYSEYKDMLVMSPSLVAILFRIYDRHHKSQDVLLEACAALINLYNVNMHSHAEVKSYLPIVTKTLAIHVEDSALIACNCNFIEVLAADKLNCGSLGVHGACRFLDTALTRHVSPSGVVVKVLGALARLAEDSAENVTAFGNTQVHANIAEAWRTNKEDSFVVENCCRSIVALLSSNNSNEYTKCFRDINIAEVVVNSLVLHAKDSAVISVAFQAVSCLVSDDTLLLQLRDQGLIEITCKAFQMHFASPSIRHISNTLKILCSTPDEATKIESCDVGGSLCQALTIHMDSIIDLSSLCEVISTIVRLAERSFAVTLVEGYDVVDILSAIIDKHQNHKSQTVLHLVSDVLNAFASKNVSLETISPTLATQAVSLINRKREDRNMVVQYCNVLSSALQGRHFVDLPINAEVQALLTALLEKYRQDELVVEAGAYVLEAFARVDVRNSDNCSHSQLFANSLRLLKAHMNCEDATVALLRAILAMNISSLNKKVFTNIDVLELVHYILKKHVESPKVCASIGDLISQIVSDNAEIKQICTQAGFCSLIVGAMQLHVYDPNATTAICQALYELCLGQKSNIRLAVEHGVADILFHALNHHKSNPVTFSALCGSISLLVANKDFSNAMMSLDIRSILIPSLEVFLEKSMTALKSCLFLLKRMYESGQGHSVTHSVDECAHLTAVTRAFLKANNVDDKRDGLHQCVTIIYFLAGSDPSTSGTAYELGEQGACELVTECLSFANSTTDTTLMTLALCAVIALVDNDQSGHNMFLFEDRTEACSLICHIMKNKAIENVSDVIEWALHAIAILSRINESEGPTSSNRKMNTFLFEEMCEVLTDYLEKMQHSTNATYLICQAMFNFCQSSNRACQRFISCGALPAFAKVLTKFADKVEILEFVQGIIFYLTSQPVCENRDIRSVVIEQFSSDTLVGPFLSSMDTVATGGDNIVFSIKALENLVKYDRILPHFVQGGALRVLNETLTNHKKDSLVLCSVLRVMLSMMNKKYVDRSSFTRDGMEKMLISVAQKNILKKKDDADLDLLENVISMLLAQYECKNDIKVQIDSGLLSLILSVLSCEILMKSLLLFIKICTLLNKVLDIVNELEHASKLCELIANAISHHRSNAEALGVSSRALSRLKHMTVNKESVGEIVFADATQHVMSRLQVDPTESDDDAAQFCHAVCAYINLEEHINQSSITPLLAKLVGVLNAFPQNVDLLIETVLTIQSIMKAVDADATSEVCQDSGLVDALVIAFNGCSTDRQVLGKELCVTLSLLFEGNNVAVINLFSRSDLCSILCSFLFNTINDKLYASEICKVTLQLCKQPNNRKFLGNSGLCDTMVLAIREHFSDEGFMATTLDLAFALTYDCPENIEKLGSSEFCGYIAQVFENDDYFENVSMVLSCVRLVCVLASKLNVRITLGTRGVCAGIVNVGEKYSETDGVFRNSIQAIRSLATNCLDNKIFLGDAGCCTLLTNLLGERMTDPVQCESVCSACATLLNSKSPDNPNFNKFEKARLIPCIADVFQSHSSNEGIAKYLFVIVKHLALATIGLSFTLRDHDILSKCVNLGQRFCKTSLSLSICECIRALSQNKENKYALGSFGVCKLVTSLISHAIDSFDAKLLEEGLLTVSSLVRGSCYNQGLFSATNICKMLASLINEESNSGESIVIKSLWCISLLCRSDMSSNSSSETNIASFAQSGVVDSLLNFYLTCLSRDELICATSWTLRNMCFDISNTKYFLKNGGYLLLMRALQHYSHVANVCEAICYALPSLLSNDDGVADCEFSLVETCDLMLYVVNNHVNEETIVHRTSCCFSIISAKSSQAAHYLGARGACSVLVRALKIHSPSNFEVIEEVCGAMWNLSINNDDNKARLGNEGACELIMDALRCNSGNKYVVETAKGCLMILSEDNPENTMRLERYKERVQREVSSPSNNSSKSSSQPRQSEIINSE